MSNLDHDILTKKTFTPTLSKTLSKTLTPTLSPTLSQCCTVVTNDDELRKPLWQRILWQAVVIMIPILTGLVIVMSASGNAGLKHTTGSIWWAVCFTYTVASVLCFVWANLTAKDNLVCIVKRACEWIHSQPFLSFKWFALCGGLCGATQNIVAALVTSKLGSAVYSLGTLAGCVIAGSVIDHFGLAWIAKRKVSWPNLVGILILTLGCILYRLGYFIGLGNDDGDDDEFDNDDDDDDKVVSKISTGTQVLCVCLAILSGVTAAFQGPLGGQLGRVCGQFRWAASWSFVSGLVPLVVLSLIVKGSPEWHGFGMPERWYTMLPGGLVICSLLVTAVWPQKYLSVALTWILLISGQILSSAILDSQGWLGLQQRELDWYNLGGILLVLVGIVVIAAAKSKQSTQQALSSEEEKSIRV